MVRDGRFVEVAYIVKLVAYRRFDQRAGPKKSSRHFGSMVRAV